MMTLRDMRSSEFLEELWHESEEIARDASIMMPMDDEEPLQKRMKVVSRRLQDSSHESFGYETSNLCFHT